MGNNCMSANFGIVKDFDGFKKFLLDNEYSEGAYKELKGSVHSFFGLLSKFHHGLDQNRVDIKPDIQSNKEDAYMAYSFSISPASHLTKN